MNGVFKQNLTSDLIFDVLSSLPIEPDHKFLDLGCGDGNIGLRVAEWHNLNVIFGSDVSKVAIRSAKESAKIRNIAADYRLGSQLDPWLNEKFDIISCDVAAISSLIAEVSDWYRDVSCLTGEDGLQLVEKIIRNVKNNLKPQGIFVIPKISLANELKLQQILEETFSEVIEVKTKKWPLPTEIVDKMHEKNLHFETENWNIKETFGMHVATTSVLTCR